LVIANQCGQLFDVLISNVLRIDTLRNRRVEGTRLMYMLESERLLHRRARMALAALRKLEKQ